MTVAVDLPSSGPPREAFEGVFSLYDVEVADDTLRYYGEPRASEREILEAVWPVFREHGYEVSFKTELGEHVLVARPREPNVDGIPWVNVGLVLLTVGTTLLAGARWYHISPSSSPWNVLDAWPFSVAVLGVLGVHELGHYVVSRYHGVEVSLPYFIPFPTFIGTLGAVIKIDGQIPDRRALFDIGVAGPLAGLVASVFVTVIGLLMSPITVPEQAVATTNAVQIQLGYPPLLQFIAWALDAPLHYAGATKSVNPIVVGGWVGMFVTFLNLLPVGQLDGGHVLRAMIGEPQGDVAQFVAVGLFGLAGYLYVTGENGNVAGLWLFWGLLVLGVSRVGSVTPIEETELGSRRKLLGAVTFLLGLLAFTPVPYRIIS